MPISVPDCDFCTIVSGGDADAREVYRDESVVAFFPTEPATLGHTLIVPKAHYPTIWDLGDDVAGRLAVATVELARSIRDAVAPDGMNIIQSNGAAATQTVFHLHVHLVPRWQGDEVGPIWPPETDYTESEKDDAWAAIRRECKRMMASPQG